ncbi:glycosyltransferase family 2 protein [Prevotella sp. SGI.167]|uniref:glycosyltransferase family 2 protein n=1 Tax=Prevotella sp. SGI.167 TaxID=3420566 RepID=UPI004040C15F
MDNALVSIIVPVYKAEKYIHQCIDSLLAQTYKNIEVILVDDGSPDHCGKICDEYAAKDCRVKVIHQQNGGVSVARQTGIDHATGEYSIHADPDDWVELNMIEELVAKAVANNADMVICDFYRESKSDRIHVCQNPGNDLSASAVLRKILSQQLHGSCWNKLVNRSRIEGIGFTPEDLCILEDELYNIRILARKIKVSYLPKALYHYRIDNENSLCNTISDKSFKLKVKAVSEIESFCLANVAGIAFFDFFPIKRNVLFDALRTKRYEVLRELYPEQKEAMINSGTPYRLLAPVSSCIALALRGYPALAYILYDWNMRLINYLQQIKRFVKR